MQSYTDDEFATLLSAGALPSAIIAAATSGVPFDTLHNWTKSRQDLEQMTARFRDEEQKRKEAAANAPIKVRAGRDEGTILKAGKNRGQAGQATGAVLEISGAPRIFLPCTPGQVASVLSEPLLALSLAIEVDRGDHDGQGYYRDPSYSALPRLKQLHEIYIEQLSERAIAERLEASASEPEVSLV